MSEVVKIENPVEPETAQALQEGRRIEAIGRLVDRMVHPPARGGDPLVAVLEATRRAAREVGLTDEDIDQIPEQGVRSLMESSNLRPHPKALDERSSGP